MELILPLTSKPLRVLEALLDLHERERILEEQEAQSMEVKANSRNYFTIEAIVQSRWQGCSSFNDEVAQLLESFIGQGYVERVQIATDKELYDREEIVGYKIPETKYQEVKELINSSPRGLPNFSAP